MKDFVKLSRKELKMIFGGGGYSFSPALGSCVENDTGKLVSMGFCSSNNSALINCGSGSVAQCIYDENANLIAAVPQSCQQFCPN
ncbi:hypothetical protein IM793_09610 [Pedobacter sp. MR2016-19]|uniref:hypothetical protein n=1 Tax=Pedobacter sp. MR2016-19 TaxID=2780089 RepID=UPI001873F4ED|nr:hypothetical protein [Pedobacter sp. MR2016-19]MBE5319415.1 hypothetical protein [Pedobacter sp. MR2016-19]